jgi:hypothetical protein
MSFPRVGKTSSGVGMSFLRVGKTSSGAGMSLEALRPRDVRRAHVKRLDRRPDRPARAPSRGDRRSSRAARREARSACFARSRTGTLDGVDRVPPSPTTIILAQATDASRALSIRASHSSPAVRRAQPSGKTHLHETPPPSSHRGHSRRRRRPRCLDADERPRRAPSRPRAPPRSRSRSPSPSCAKRPLRNAASRSWIDPLLTAPGARDRATRRAPS